MSLYDFQVKTIDGEEKSLKEYKGSVLLIVNTATKCGFTPQLTGLQQLHETYRDQGFAVLGFPCGQFMNQELDHNDEIKQVCQLNHGVTFPLFSKIEVIGDQAHPLFAYLTNEARGVLGSKAIKWNFTKFLVNRQGEVVQRFAPTDKPEDIEKEIKKLL